MVPLGDGRWATSDINDLYKRVINRTDRVGLLMQLKTPAVIMVNESTLLQESIDTLFANEAIPRPIINDEGKALRSISGELEQNLKGFFEKRQDYSGTAVATYTQVLDNNHCALPANMLLKLYEPAVIHNLRANGDIHTMRQGRVWIEKLIADDKTNETKIRQALEIELKEHPVVVSYNGRATALYPSIHGGDSFAVNSQVAQNLALAFNGDKVSLYAPIRKEAVEEAKSMAGRYIKAEGNQVNSMFSRLSNEGSYNIAKRAITGEGLPLSKLDQILLR